eukprot:PITA_02889
MDVKTTFLNGNIEEEVYIEQLEGFKTFNHESHVCRLKRALYEMKQAPCAWYTKIDSYFTGLGFTKSEVDVSLYHIMVEGEFKMKEMGLMRYFLGMKVWQKDGEVLVYQGKYANEILRRFHMEKCKPMQTYLAGNWRKEDATSVNQPSQDMVQPTKLFWKEAKHVLRCPKGTSRYGLWYRRGVKLQRFIDVDWAGSPSNRKRTLGGIFNLGSALVSWYNRKHRLVALSSIEAEYMAAKHVRPFGSGKF